MQLFLSEAEKARQLAGASVVPVLDVVQSPAHRAGEFLCFIVMEMMEGGSLAQKLERGERPGPRQAAQWIASLADTLAHVHSHGYIHRDIKPDNILFDAAGRPYFSDFGLAASAAEQLAENRSMLGTVIYMAPEQARRHRVDRQADIYSLGVVLYHLLALPYVSDSRLALPYLANSSAEYLEALADPNHQVRALPEGVPVRLAEIVEQRCLKGDKSQRYRSAAEFSRDLRQWLRAERQWLRRSLLIAGGSLAAAAAGYGAFLAAGRPDRPDDGPTPVTAAAPRPAIDEAIQLVSLLDQTAPNPASWSVNEALTALTIHDQDRTLISFGSCGDEVLDFEITLQQPQWPGQLGVFFGHSLGQSARAVQYQLVQLIRRRNGSFLLRASANAYDSNTPHDHHATHIYWDRPIDNFQSHGNDLRFHVEGGRPIGLWLNQLDLGSEFVTNWQENLRSDERNCRGHFGAYAARGPANFLNPILSGRRILIRQ